MHTFFINTSEKSINRYDELFDIHHDNKELVSFNYPIKSWIKSAGYKECAKQIGEMVDSYKELNNSFNLIVYIDLASFKEYSSMLSGDVSERKRAACLQAMYILFTRVMHKTIVAELSNCGREPSEILIIFGENRKIGKDSVGNDDNSRMIITSDVYDFIGLPEVSTVENIAKSILAVNDSSADEKLSELCRKVSEAKKGGLLEDVYGIFEENIKTWCAEILSMHSVEKANKVLCNILFTQYNLETGSERKGIKKTSLISDVYADHVNKRLSAIRDLMLSCYLLRCIESGTIYESAGNNKYEVRALKEENLEDVISLLISKQSLYKKRIAELKALSETFTELHLAPELYELDGDRFGLDEFGKKSKKVIVTDVEEADDKGKDTPSENSEQKKDDAVLIEATDKETVVVGSDIKPLFSNDEYKKFDYMLDSAEKAVSKAGDDPDTYLEQATKLREHHLDYLNRLEMHIANALSNYAGRSVGNAQAVLRKRNVSVCDEVVEDQGREYKYTKPGMPQEKHKDTIDRVSDKAYDTAQKEYLKFCASRSVAITDIEEQCNWFVNRVHQITESLKKTKLIAIGLLVAILVVYVPFVVIQWEAIFENLLTVLCAVGSIAVPIVLLYVVFVFVSASQRRKYAQAWDEFKAKSDEVLKENSLTVQNYDNLLTFYIPMLRWVYEYKLDVDFYMDCCKIAEAKMAHHRSKMRKRYETIGNMLEDLELDSSHTGQLLALDDEVDYNVAYCSGEKNKKFYSILDIKRLDSMKNR